MARGRPRSPALKTAGGVICTLKLDANGNPRPVNKRMYATFTSYRALFRWFPDAEVCLDWIHAVEKLWKCAKAVNRASGAKRAPLEDWIQEQRKRLRNGQLDEVVATLQAALDDTAVTGPGNKTRRKVLQDTIKHFVKNRVRMNYQKLRQHGLVISSGLVEGAVRHLVGMRLDGPGMRWGKARAEAVLQLRCVLLNGLWADFEAHLARRGSLRLASKPVPTVTHDAKPQVKEAA